MARERSGSGLFKKDVPRIKVKKMSPYDAVKEGYTVIQKYNKKKKMMGGGKVMKYSKGGKIDGIALRGKTRARMV